MEPVPLLALGLLLALATFAAPVDRYNVVWDSPSKDHHGSMPLGNGDVALNAWMTADGDLQFYIAKTDAWDDYGRLLKVGKVRVQFDPSPLVAGKPFRQELRLSEGCVEITTGADAASGIRHPASGIPSPTSTLRLWVDANHPVIHVTAESATPMAATASVELWRTNEFEAEIQVSDVLLNRKLPGQKQAPLIVQPDTLLTGQRDRGGWFHHNAKSIGPRLMAEIQGLTGFPQPDPLLHRTFGAVVTAAGGERLDDLRLRSPRGTKHTFSIFVLTRHPVSPEQWLADLDASIRRVEARSFAERRAARHARAGTLGYATSGRMATSWNRFEVGSIWPARATNLWAGVEAQRLSGSLLLALDCLSPLESVSLRDFQFASVSPSELHIHYQGLFSGDLWATLTSFGMFHASPGPQKPFEAFSQGSGTFTNVPFLMQGLAAYRAEGGICALLTNTSYGCTGTVNLGDRPRMGLNPFTAQLTLASKRLALDGTFPFAEDLDPSARWIGTISGQARIVAHGPAAPCLRMERDLFEHRIRWATNFADFQIETNATPASAAAWQPVGFEPVLDGATYMQTFDWGPGSQAFYRLRSK